jgi:hypothetical protein
MGIREQIMRLTDPFERHPTDALVEHCADLAEARERELLAEIANLHTMFKELNIKYFDAEREQAAIITGLLLDLENESRENELLKQSAIGLKSELEKYKIKYMNHDLMAGCMDMTRQGLIDAGIFGASVPPMFVTEAVLGHIGKLHGRQSAMIAELQEILTRANENQLPWDELQPFVYCSTLKEVINKYKTS